MKDFVGNETEVGDTVVVTRNDIKALTLAKVVSIHPKTVNVEFVNWCGETVNKFVTQWVKVMPR